MSAPKYVTGFAKRDHIPRFEMYVLQRSVFPQSNVGVLWKRRCCSNNAKS